MIGKFLNSTSKFLKLATQIIAVFSSFFFISSCAAQTDNKAQIMSFTFETLHEIINFKKPSIEGYTNILQAQTKKIIDPPNDHLNEYKITSSHLKTVYSGLITKRTSLVSNPYGSGSIPKDLIDIWVGLEDSPITYGDIKKRYGKANHIDLIEPYDIENPASIDLLYEIEGHRVQFFIHTAQGRDTDRLIGVLIFIPYY